MNQIEEWVNLSKDNTELNFRRVVHIVLHAISSHHELQPEMIMKGGILLAIIYRTGRYTKDIDFSTPKHYKEFQNGEDEFIRNLENAIKISAEILPFGLACRIQKRELKPGSEGNYQTLHLNIGYALKSQKNEMAKLNAGSSAKVVSIDYSFNEKVGDIGLVDAGGEDLRTYGQLTVIAEKFRALLQQTSGNGGRRKGSPRGQDIFDLHTILTEYPVNPEEYTYLLSLLISKSKDRDLIVNKNSMSNPEIKERSKQRYLQLEDEIDGVLPDFNLAFDALKKFYETLPWADNS
ncbi:nucleotidyl transferase AbiEii/AbiGii toxin family protein [Undibacterium sp. JH2W]|uniref:nucleotidyl transferase AbiEii/AbiGii toxin family protein n=1 Tax=Undibacterium sp. JH2W TaxID=3413037 RepID=UPI003BF454B3